MDNEELVFGIIKEGKQTFRVHLPDELKTMTEVLIDAALSGVADEEGDATLLVVLSIVVARCFGIFDTASADTLYQKMRQITANQRKALAHKHKEKNGKDTDN